MSKLKPTSGRKAQYARYKAENRWQKNKIRKLENTVLAQPNNKQAEEQLKRISKGIVFNKKKPKSRNRNTLGKQERILNHNVPKFLLTKPEINGKRETVFVRIN